MGTKDQGIKQSSLQVSKLPLPHSWYLGVEIIWSSELSSLPLPLYVSSLGNGFCQSVGDFHVQSYRETWYFFLFKWVKCQAVNREWLKFIKTAPRYFGPLESCSSPNCPSMLRQPKMSSPKAVKFDSSMIPRHFCRSAQEKSSPWSKKKKVLF